MSSTLLSHPLVKELSPSQFANFISSVWNSESFKGWAEPKAMWQGIAAFEATREFTQGWDYCDSELRFTGTERSWRYKTTSGTLIEVSQTRMRGGDDALSPPRIRVTIPPERVGGYHAELLHNSIAGMEFFSWGNLFYSKEGTPAYAEARRRGCLLYTSPSPRD